MPPPIKSALCRRFLSRAAIRNLSDRRWLYAGQVPRTVALVLRDDKLGGMRKMRKKVTPRTRAHARRIFVESPPYQGPSSVFPNCESRMVAKRSHTELHHLQVERHSSALIRSSHTNSKRSHRCSNENVLLCVGAPRRSSWRSSTKRNSPDFRGLSR